MVYYLVRIIIFLIIFLATIFFRLKKKTFIIRNSVRTFIIVFIVCYLSFQIPVEYVFMKFSSYDEAFSYGHNPNSVIKVVESKNMAVILYTQDNDSVSFFPIDKEEDRWKIDPVKSYYTPHKFYNFHVIYEFTSSNHADTFLFFVNPSFLLNTPKISDTRSSRFTPIEFDLNGTHWIIYHTITTPPDKNYTITVDSDSFALK